MIKNSNFPIKINSREIDRLSLHTQLVKIENNYSICRIVFEMIIL